MSLDGLSYKQRLFIEAYLGPSSGNATDAARRAGYKSPHPIGARLLQKATIAAAIAARLDSAALPANHILAILSDHATASPDDFGDVDENGFRLRLDKAKRRKKLHCIKKLKPVRIRVDDDNAGPDSPAVFRTDYEIEFYDAQAALDKLGKFHGLWKDKVEQVGQQVIRVTYDDNLPPDHRQLAPPAPGPDGDPADDAAVQRPELREEIRQDEAGDLPAGAPGP